MSAAQHVYAPSLCHFSSGTGSIPSEAEGATLVERFLRYREPLPVFFYQQMGRSDLQGREDAAGGAPCQRATGGCAAKATHGFS